MKKLLALVLALVMVLSLCVTSNAAYTDAADVELDEAVDVLTTVGVFQGSDGKFDPKANLTREQAAKLVAYLQIGQKAADALVGGGKFSDVAKDRWSAGYVDYCASIGIAAGVGDSKFDPTGSLTALQFGKMLLVCLGYDAKAEGMVGTDWTINTSKLMASADLLANLDAVTANSVVTREQAAQMMLNALKAPMVEYANKSTSISVNGADVVFGGSTASFVTGKIDSVDNIIQDYTNDQTKYGIIELGEKLFPKLVLDPDTDAFGRPAHTWIYDKKDIGTYADNDKLVVAYTSKVAGKDVFAALGKNVVEEYTFYLAVNGVYVDSANTLKEIHKNNKNDLTISDKGRLVEFYVDKSAETVDIVVVDTYLAQANADYNAKKDEVKLTVWTAAATTANKTVSGEDFDIKDVKEDDFFLVTIADGDVETLVAPAVMSGVEISEYTVKTDKTVDKLTVDGTSYAAAAKAFYDADVLKTYTTNAGNKTHLKEATYNVFTYDLGDVTYVIGVEEVEAVLNYVFITGIDAGASNLNNKTYDANAIFLDGTCEKIAVENKNGVADNALTNSWYTYKVSNDGVYTLTEVASNTFDSTKHDAGQNHTDLDGETIDGKHITLAGDNTTTKGFAKVYGNDDSIYMVAELKGLTSKAQGNITVISGVESITTGISNVSIVTKKAADAKKTGYNAGAGGVYTLFNDKGYIIAAVVVGEDGTVSDNVVYTLADSLVSEKYDKTSKTWTWTRKVILNGEEIVLTETNDTGVSTLANMDAQSWYVVTYKADGTVKGTATKLATNTATWDDSVAANTKHVYVDSMADAAAAVAKDIDTVVMMNNYNANMLGTSGNVVFEATNADKGVYVDGAVKTVLSQKTDNKRQTSYLEGFTALKNLLGDLNKNPNADYDMSLVIKDGRVTSVVVYDNNNDGYTGTPVVVTSGVAVDGVNVKSISVPATANQTQIAAAVEAQGLNKVVIVSNGTPGAGYYGLTQASAKYCPFFTYSVTGAETVTFIITNAKTNAVEFVDTKNLAAAGPDCICINLKDLDQTGTLALASGTYNWSIRTAGGLFGGSFTYVAD